MRTVGRMLLRRAMPARPSVSVTTVARLSSFTPARFLNVLAAHPTSRLASALQLPHAVRGFAASAAGARLSHSQPQPSGIPRAPGAEDRLISVPPAGPLARWPLARTHRHTHTHTHCCDVVTHLPPPTDTEEQYEFQTETRQVLDIVTHSLYTDRCELRLRPSPPVQHPSRL